MPSRRKFFREETFVRPTFSLVRLSTLSSRFGIACGCSEDRGELMNISESHLHMRVWRYRRKHVTTHRIAPTRGRLLGSSRFVCVLITAITSTTMATSDDGCRRQPGQRELARVWLGRRSTSVNASTTTTFRSWLDNAERDLVSSSRLDGNKPAFPRARGQARRERPSRGSMKAPRHTCARVCIFHSGSFNVGPAESASSPGDKKRELPFIIKLLQLSTYIHICSIYSCTKSQPRGRRIRYLRIS